MNIDNLNNINNENNNDDGNGGNRSKFSDRLKKILNDRMKFRSGVHIGDDSEESVMKRWGRNILKVFLAMPSVIYSTINSYNKKNKNIGNKDIVNATSVVLDPKKNNQIDNPSEFQMNRRIKVNKIKEINISLLKKQREIYLREIKKHKNNNVNIYDEKIIEQSNEIDKELQIKKLQKEIIDLIKKKLVSNVNELEILQSELYLLKELKFDDIYLLQCQEDIKEIKKLLSKIKSLKEKYDYLKDNVDFEYMLEYEDDLLINKILELKELCTSSDIKYVVDNYKILNEYKFLYLKIDKLQENTIKYDEYKREKEKELKKRDIDFDKLKIDVYDVDKDKNKYENFVHEQELFLKSLEEKIANIDSNEQVTYRLKGFNRLLSNSFKYLGLLLVNPLKGIIPSIATQTVVTKNIIRNLYSNLEWEEDRRIVYDAIDYSTSINYAINNLDNTLSMVNSTLEDIIKLKNKYMKEFSKYQYSFSDYRDMIKKINKIENAVLGSRIKIEIMQHRMKEKEKQNEEKMKKVKILNSSNNN